MKDLEKLLTEVNKFYDERDVDGLFTFARGMIEQYTAGKQEQHLRAVNAIEMKYKNGVSSKAQREQYARRELSKLIGNVCLNEKVI